MAKEKVEYNPNTHGDLVKSAIKEASDALIVAESSRNLVGDIRKRLQEECGLEGKIFNQMLKIYHKDAREQIENENDELLEAYDAIFGG